MCMRGYGGNGVYGSLWECMGKYMSAHKFIQYTWVDVSVVSLGDCKEFLWFSWVYVSECEVYDCNWVYFGVFGSMWVYVSVFECMWMLWVYLSVVWTSNFL